MAAPGGLQRSGRLGDCNDCEGIWGRGDCEGTRRHRLVVASSSPRRRRVVVASSSLPCRLMLSARPLCRYPSSWVRSEGLGGFRDCEGHLGGCSDCEGAWGAAATVMHL